MQKLIVIVGPTASGKSEFAAKLAKRIEGEIISADSRQVYKGLDIGTAKVKGQRCVDIANPKKRVSVVEWRKCAGDAIAMIYHSGKIPILVGGTAFYIKTLVDGLELPQVPPNPKLRSRLEKFSAEKLFRLLAEKDPARAETIEGKNKRRLIRALEIVEAMGKVPPLRKAKKYEAIYIGIKRTPQELKKRIEARTQKMLKQGLIREVKKLKKLGLSWKRIYELGFEYKYPALYLQKKISKQKMIDSINKESLDYARRQMLWWKKDKKIRWVKDSSKIPL